MYSKPLAVYTQTNPPIKVYETHSEIIIEIPDLDALLEIETITTEQNRRIAVFTCKLFDVLGIGRNGDTQYARQAVWDAMSRKFNKLVKEKALIAYLTNLEFEVSGKQPALKPVVLHCLNGSGGNQPGPSL